MGRCLRRLGALPETAVWDREGAIAPPGKPTEPFLAFCGPLSLGWLILEAADPQSKGALERSHRFMRSNFESARLFANEPTSRRSSTRWSDKANPRIHRGIRAVARRAPRRGARLMRAAARAHARRPTHRLVTRVPQQPYLRFDTNDYSIDPRFAGRRVELRAGQREIVAVALDTRRARGPPPALASPSTSPSPIPPTSESSTAARRPSPRPEVEVESRPLARYDALIPA